MSLTLVLGPANSAKAGEVLGAYGLARRRGALLVVPTAHDAELYTRELAGEGSVLGGAEVTFSGLYREIARRTAYAGSRLSPLQRERVLRRALAGAELGVLDRSADAPGFAAAALELISELERSLITPQRFAQALEAWAAGDSRRESYGRDLASLYRRYSRALERLGRVDAELYAWRALDSLREAPGMWDATPVFVYGFDDLTPLERDAIETLSRIAGADVTVSLTYEAGRGALAARAEVVEELRPLAERVLELPALDEFYEPGSREALHMIERRLFEPGAVAEADRVDPGAAVRLLEAGGERAELELVAAEVLALLRSGVPGGQIVVVFRSLARTAALVERVFSEFAIPVSVEREIPFAHTSLGRGVLALARCAFGTPSGGEGTAADLLAYLRAPGVLEPIELADRLEAIVMREGLRTAAQARERADLRLGEVDALRSSDEPLRELERQARRLLAAPRRGEAAVLGARERLDARALAVLTRSLSELAELGEAVSGGELVELLEGLTVASRSRPGEGAVIVAEPLSIRAQRFRAVFVCGLQEGSFPAPGAPEPFLSDERRRELAVASGLRLRPREDVLARERYLFYSCLSRATEQVVLSYRSSDEEGNVELASPFIADVAELFVPEWAQRRRRRLLADVVWGLDEAPTARELARAQAAAAADTDEVRSEAPIPALGEVALGHVRHREILSAGALESYADCPVKWLIERELRPGTLEPEGEPIVRGSVMHGLLEQLFERLGGPVTAQSLPEANRILDQLLAEPIPALARGRPEAVRRAAVRSIEADLRRYLVHEATATSDWTPEALELRFGFEEESLPALELSDDVRLRGVIDRVDVDGAGRAIIRDYKSGPRRAQYQGGRWSTDRQLQVALYMLAVRQLLGLEPVAGLYQPLGGDDLRARGLFLADSVAGTGLVGTDARSPEELEQALVEARERAMGLAEPLRSGEIEPCPGTCSRGGCAYPGICRSG